MDDLGHLIKYSNFKEVEIVSEPFKVIRGLIPILLWANGHRYELQGVQLEYIGEGYFKEVGLYECVELNVKPGENI